VAEGLGAGGGGLSTGATSICDMHNVLKSKHEMRGIHPHHRLAVQKVQGAIHAAYAATLQLRSHCFMPNRAAVPLDRLLP
jgi:hypothetical protein